MITLYLPPGWLYFITFTLIRQCFFEKGIKKNKKIVKKKKPIRTSDGRLPFKIKKIIRAKIRGRYEVRRSTPEVRKPENLLMVKDRYYHLIENESFSF